MEFPTDRKYAETHEWYRPEGDVVTMGITQFAADELTDITYVELPEPGSPIEPGQTCGELESVKATSDVVSVVGGEVIERNDALIEHPEKLNEDAFGDGWMLRIRAEDLSPLNALMDAGAYREHIAQSPI